MLLFILIKDGGFYSYVVTSSITPASLTSNVDVKPARLSSLPNVPAERLQVTFTTPSQPPTVHCSRIVSLSFVG